MSYVNIILFNMFSVCACMKHRFPLRQSKNVWFISRWFIDSCPYSPIDNIISLHLEKFELLMAFDLFFSFIFHSFRRGTDCLTTTMTIGAKSIEHEHESLVSVRTYQCTVCVYTVIIFFYFLLSTLWQSTNFILTTNTHTSEAPYNK